MRRLPRTICPGPLGRRCPLWWPWVHKRGGARSHPSMVSSGWGLSTLRLLWNISRGWTLHHSCSRRQSRRCLGTLSRRVAYGSLKSARAISGRGTGLTPGPESMPSGGANHGEKLRRAAGDCKCLQEAED